MTKKRRVELLIPAFFILLLFLCVIIGVIFVDTTNHSAELIAQQTVSQKEDGTDELAELQEAEEEQIHIPIPGEVRAIYWTAVTATTDRGDELLSYMLNTGLNAVVIDVKMDNGQLLAIDDFEEILETLFDAGIYRIARIAVMRDGAFAREHPEVALRSAAGGFWYDSIGSIWVDPAAKGVSDYAIELGQQFYEAGFDEIQYDYVRFASDGALSSIRYPVYDLSEAKVEVMQRFFERVGGSMREEGIPVSFDLFGMTFWSHHDYNIGQRLIDVLPYADWVSPMVYPSHYPNGFNGYGNPAQYPYEIVKESLDAGHTLMAGVYAGTDEELRYRFRPWLQDFDIGAVYTSEKIEAQIRAARDAGASGWMLWNARNVYEPMNYVFE